MFTILFGSPAPGFGLGWSEQTIRLLPDSSFAMIEVSEDGKRYRRCPHYDANGNLDMEQLIYVLGTFEKEKWLDKKNKKQAQQLLKKYYDKFKTKTLKNQVQTALNINKAKLTELVVLPNIGPVLAVKIAEYRDTHSRFLKIEDIKNVEGIGIRTFNAIRHYIRVD
jgi:competence ComEA-like helix-hairpin-helix protein